MSTKASFVDVKCKGELDEASGEGSLTVLLALAPASSNVNDLVR